MTTEGRLQKIEESILDLKADLVYIVYLLETLSEKTTETPEQEPILNDNSTPTKYTF